jgi:hypothetical protein
MTYTLQIGGPVHGLRDRQGTRRNANAMVQANLHVIDPAALAGALGGRTELHEPEQAFVRTIVVQELKSVLEQRIMMGQWTFAALESGSLERELCDATAKAYETSKRRMPGTSIEVTMARLLFT